MLNQDHCKPAKLIVCVLDRGRSKEVLQALEASEHILASEYVSIRNQGALMEDKEWEEMDSLRVAVAPQYAESVFEKLYYVADIENHEGAFMYQMNIPWITHFELPDMPAEGVNIAALEEGKGLPEDVDEKTADALRKLVD